jgi:hypothetical protein
MRKVPTADKNISTPGTAVYISPSELVLRWRISRTQVDRVARREGLKRLLLGHGRNGTVRYVRAEVESLERRRLT